jgi:hypothetical protein
MCRIENSSAISSSQSQPALMSANIHFIATPHECAASAIAAMPATKNSPVRNHSNPPTVFALFAARTPIPVVTTPDKFEECAQQSLSEIITNLPAASAAKSINPKSRVYGIERAHGLARSRAAQTPPPKAQFEAAEDGESRATNESALLIDDVPCIDPVENSHQV